MAWLKFVPVLSPAFHQKEPHHRAYGGNAHTDRDIQSKRCPVAIGMVQLLNLVDLNEWK